MKISKQFSVVLFRILAYSIKKIRFNRPAWSWLLLILLLPTFFQNCQVSAPARFLSLSSLKSQQSSTSGNGVGVEGKPLGTFVRNVPKFCSGQNKPFGVLNLSQKENVLNFYDLVTCEEKRKSIEPDKVIVSAFDRNIIALDDGAYEKADPVIFEKEPVAIEAWCASQEKSPLEVHLKHDFKNSKYFAKIYFQRDSKNLVVGPTEIQRAISSGSITYKSASMEMSVDISAPSMTTFEYKSHLVAKLDDVPYDVDLKCRLGADHDGSIWPATPILSSVENFQMINDFANLLFIKDTTQDSLSGDSGLYFGKTRDLYLGKENFVRLDDPIEKKTGFHVIDLKVSPIEDRVAFRTSAQTFNGTVELHSATISSGQVTKVSSNWSSSIPASTFANLDSFQIPAVKDNYSFSEDGRKLFFNEESSLVNNNGIVGFGLGFPVLSLANLETSTSNTAPFRVPSGALAQHQKILQTASGEIYINGVSPDLGSNAILFATPPFQSDAKVLIDQAMLPQGYQIKGGSDLRLSEDGEVLFFTVSRLKLYSTSLNQMLMAFNLSSKVLITVDSHLSQETWPSGNVSFVGKNVVIFDGSTIRVLSAFGHVLLAVNHSGLVSCNRQLRSCVFSENLLGQLVIKKIDLDSLAVSSLVTFNLDFNFGTIVEARLQGSRLFVLSDTDGNGLYELYCLDFGKKALFAVSDRFVEYGGVTRFDVKRDGTEVIFLSTNNLTGGNSRYLFKWTDGNEF